MTREKIGEIYTNDNGKAQMQYDISNITQDFKIEAVYEEYNDSIDFTNITYELTLTADETSIESGARLELSGELTSSDESLINGELIYIYAKKKNSNNTRIQTVIVSNNEFNTIYHNLEDGIYQIYARWRNNRVITDNLRITVGTPVLSLTSEKQYINTSEDSNQLILSGQYNVGVTPIGGQEIKIYDGSTLISTKTTNDNGRFEVPLSNISRGMHLYKATGDGIESVIFEVFVGTGEEIVIETNSPTISFGYSNNKLWLDTDGETAVIEFGDGTTTTVNNPVTPLTHTFNNNKQKHMVVLYSPYNRINGLGYEFLRGNTGVTSILFGSEVYYLGAYAFYGCTGLTSITFPDQFQTIGDSAFEACTGLQKVVIFDLKQIRSKMFYGCTGINEYILGWRGLNNIIAYDSNIFPTNLLTKFIVPSGEVDNYISKGYPSSKIEMGKVEINITANKIEYNMDEQIIIYITLKENGLPIPWAQFNLELNTILTTWTATLTADKNGQLSGTLGNPARTGGQDINIKVTYGNVSDVLNIDGNIYKNSLQEPDNSNWLLRDAIIDYNQDGLEITGNGDGALILNKKLFKYGYHPIIIEYDLINSPNGYSYLNYLFDENLEDRIIQLAKKPYGVKGTILDEYPYTDNWINTLFNNNTRVKVRISKDETDTSKAKLELFANQFIILRKVTDYTNVENKLFAFGTINDSYAIYKNLKIYYDESYNLNLTADKTSIESGETATITASIGSPDKKLYYQIKNGTSVIYDGSVITGNNGAASIQYTGTGAGDIDIIFTYFDIEKKIRISDGAGKIQTILTLTSPTDDETFYSDETINITGVLRDKDGNPLANKTIKIDSTEVQ